MAFTNTDPSIPMGGVQPFGDPKQLNALAQWQMRMQQVQQTQQSQNALKGLFSDPANLDESGMPNRNALAQLMRQAPETGLETMNTLAKWQEHRDRRQITESKISEAARARGGEIRDGALAIYNDMLAKGATPEAAQRQAQEYYSTETDGFRKSGLVSNPAMIAPNFDPERARRNKLAEDAAQAKTESPSEGWKVETDYGPAKPVQYRYRTGPDGKPQTTDMQGNPYTPTGVAETKGAEATLYKAKTPDGKDVTVQLGSGGWHDEKGAPVTVAPGSVTRMGTSQPADAEAIDATAQAIAEYRQAPLTSMAMRGSSGPLVMKRIHELNPNYDAKYYAPAQRTLTAFDVGRQGDQVRSLNVTIQHLGVFDDLGKALQNRDTNAINRVLNYVQSELGHPEVTSFDAAKTVIADEVVKSVVGSGAVFDRESMQRNLNSARSPQQLEDIQKTIKSLMAGQLRGLRRQFTSAHLPTEEFDQKLDPETRKALEDLGGASGGADKVGVVSTKEERDALPPGAKYRLPNDPPGASRTKQ